MDEKTLQIKVLYKLAESKKQLIVELANHFNMNPISIRNHWFSNHWAIPENKKEMVLSVLKKYAKAY